MRKRLVSIAAVGLTAATLLSGPVSIAAAAPVDPRCASASAARVCVPFDFPTASADGSLPFLGWVSPNANAQADRGYRSPSGAFDIYLDRVYDGPGNYTATVYRRGGFDLRAADGSNASGTKFTYTVEPGSVFRLTPAEPTLVDLPGVVSDTVVFPDERNGSYKFSSVTDMRDGRTRFRVAFTPAPGYALASSGSWDRVVDGKAVWLLFADRS